MTFCDVLHWFIDRTTGIGLRTDRFNVVTGPIFEQCNTGAVLPSLGMVSIVYF